MKLEHVIWFMVFTFTLATLLKNRDLLIPSFFASLIVCLRIAIWWLGREKTGEARKDSI